MNHRSSLALLLLLPILSLGCAANPWKKNFEPNRSIAPLTYSPSDSVQVRDVEFERLQKYSAAEKQMRIESTTNPADYTLDQQLAAKNRLLEALQLKERGEEIELLGWSEFADNQNLDPHSPKLADFAKSIGADYVVVASRYLGKVTTTIDRPMTTYSSGYLTVVPGRNGRRAYTRTESVQSTTWVPTNVVEDRYLFTAAFLRRSR